MIRAVYLATILASALGVAYVARRLGLWRRRLMVVVPSTALAFLAFDALGSGRGWFASSSSFSLGIFPPGIPLEEPFLLGFLALLAVTLQRLAARLLREP